ncbi:MAG: hypothetical protein IH624_03440 [Phycisphaerae bacterium]|nr:hypothetical protein [Phycisphaerae bacterium]
MLKWLKRGLIVAAGGALIGSLVFGKDMLSYVKSSAKWTRTAVKDSVPVEFELKRAHDLLEEIIPEMHRNIRLIAQEEVEIAALKADIVKGEKSFGEEKQRISNLRNALNVQKASYTFGNQQYSREELKQDLAWRFDRFKEAEVVLASKQRMLASRETGLRNSMQLLEKTRAQKYLLASKIESLEAQHRLVKATSVGTGVHFDNSKIAQTEKLIDNIKKRLDVAERILAHESNFVQTIPVDGVKEVDLLTEIDAYFGPGATKNAEGKNVSDSDGGSESGKGEKLFAGR